MLWDNSANLHYQQSLYYTEWYEELSLRPCLDVCWHLVSLAKDKHPKEILPLHYLNMFRVRVDFYKTLLNACLFNNKIFNLDRKTQYWTPITIDQMITTVLRGKTIQHFMGHYLYFIVMVYFFCTIDLVLLRILAAAFRTNGTWSSGVASMSGLSYHHYHVLPLLPLLLLSKCLTIQTPWRGDY